MVKAIVFDFDGVLVDSEPLHYQAIVRAIEPFGVRLRYADYVDRFVGYGDDRDCLRLVLKRWCRRPDLAACEQTLDVLCETKATAYGALVREGVEMLPGARAFVEEAAARFPLAIASGASRQDIELMLNGLGLRRRFDVIVSADDVTRFKPDPMTYRLACDRLACRSEGSDLSCAECLAVEDSAAGIASARAAGLMTLGVATTGSAAQLRLADQVVNSLAELTMRQIGQWFA